jgi:putative transposase
MVTDGPAGVRQRRRWRHKPSGVRPIHVRSHLARDFAASEPHPVILHSNRGTQFTSAEYQPFLKDHHIVSSMSGVGHCGDNAAAEGFFGKLKRERIHRRRHLMLAEARADVFDYIERFHNPIIQKRLDARDQAFRLLTQPSVETG